MYTDARGLAVTATCQNSVDQLDIATVAYLGARRDTLERTEKLRVADPECPLADCLAGFLYMHRGKPESAQAAKDSLASAARKASLLSVSRREQLHIDSLQAWTEGDLVGAVHRWEAILVDHPRDILAIRLSQFMTSYLGNSRGICDSIERVFPRWDGKVPGYGYLLGCYAYGLEETAQYSRAEQMGRTAVERNPSDLWAAHAVAHVMEMQGRPRDGLAWMAENARNWGDCNNFVLHLKWHGALYHLSLGDFDRVLEVYDREVRAEATDEYLDIANAASILWRLEQADIAVGNRWEELAERAAKHLDDHLFVFADLHYMLAAAAGKPGLAQKFLQSCSLFAQSGRGTQAKAMHDVGLAIAQAIVANRQGRYGEAAAHLLPRRKLIHRVGGSHAQRDTFEMLLIDSVIRGGNESQARMLLAERTASRSHDLWSWRTLAEVSESAGDTEGAANARTRLAGLSGHAGSHPSTQGNP